MFITFEGIEGVGKSTQIKYLSSRLKTFNIPHILTREPGGSEMGEEIRNILLSHRKEDVSKEAELLLMFAARAQHLHAVIKPALAKKHWVLCDRFTDATYAYQGGGRFVPMSEIALLEQLVQGDLKPTYTILLDANVDVALSRMRTRGSGQDRFEQEKISFFERVRAVYLERAKAEPKRFYVLNAALTESEIQLQMDELLEGFIRSDTLIT